MKPFFVYISVDGGFSAWRDVSTCTKSCGNGELEQYRTCTNPAPEFAGKECQGISFRTVTCNLRECQGKTSDQICAEQFRGLKSIPPNALTIRH